MISGLEGGGDPGPRNEEGERRQLRPGGRGSLASSSVHAEEVAQPPGLDLFFFGLGTRSLVEAFKADPGPRNEEGERRRLEAQPTQGAANSVQAGGPHQAGGGGPTTTWPRPLLGTAWKAFEGSASRQETASPDRREAAR